MHKVRNFFLKLAIVAIVLAPSISLFGVHFNPPAAAAQLTQLL